MTKKKLSVVLHSIIILTTSRSALADSRWQYWTTFGFTDAVSNNVTLKFAPELRYKGGFSGHYYTHFDMGFDWEVNEWLTLGSYYRHVEEKKKDKWEIEKRPHLNATIKGKIFGLAVSNRSRLEYRITEDDDFFRYRNKLTFKGAKKTQFEIQPYIADEPFYDFDADEFNKNRFYAGFGCMIFNKLKADLYYMLESQRKNGHWKDFNVLGINFTYSF
jgi:hypothetical protein